MPTAHTSADEQMFITHESPVELQAVPAQQGCPAPPQIAISLDDKSPPAEAMSPSTVVARSGALR